MRGLWSTLALGLVLAGLGAYIYFVESERPASGVTTNEKVFAGVESGQVNEVSLTTAGQTSVLVKKDSGWQMTAPETTDADVTEASSLAEDKVEDLRTLSLDSTRFVNGTDQVDARGVADEDGPYTRTWTISPGTDTTIVSVSVSWTERGNEPYTISMADMRTGVP